MVDEVDVVQDDADDAFAEARARALLCAAGEDAAHASLLSLGENAVFGTADGGPVVRVGRRDPELVVRAERELRVADWLSARGIPAVRPARPDVRLVSGHPVTYWERLPEPVREAGAADLAALVRQVHALSEPPFPLPPRDLLAGVERWLRLAGDTIPAADAAYLRSRRDEFAAGVKELEPALPPGPLHGDALPRNVRVTPDGPVLVDLETFASDLREHDLVVMALSRDRYGLPDAEYAAFTEVYGWDVRDWEGCALLRGARETASCAWVAQRVPGNPAAAREFTRRVASLRDGDTAVRWHAF